MSKFKIRSVKQLEAEMRAVARGERRPPKDAAVRSFNSVDTVLRLLTPENRKLMALIRDKKPGSIAALAQMTGRAAPNLTRTLQKMEAAGVKRPNVDVGVKLDAAYQAFAEADDEWGG